MTENKRFKNVEEKLDWGTIQYFTYDDEKITDDEIENLVNQLLEQNEQLKQSFKEILKDLEATTFDKELLEKENEQLKQEMEKLKAQLLYTDSVCDICANHSLVQKEEYYISKCKKGHEECSKIDLNYCEDFELVGDYK